LVSQIKTVGNAAEKAKKYMYLEQREFVEA
jgi:hypothetical protein